MLKQIILITDGCSNEGVSPVVAAAQAQLEGVIVNVIGIVNEGELGDRGAAEIEAIARAGGGISRMVSPRRLAQTVQMMTHKTVMHTIRGMVNQQLGQVLKETGNSHSIKPTTLEELPLFQRAQVVKVIENLSETAALQIALLVDASTSMRPKLQAVEDAIRDLMLSFQARKGLSEIAVFHFPGSPQPSGVIEMDTCWTKDLAKIANLFYKLNMKGTTPTGPALFRLLQFMTHGELNQEEHRVAAYSREPYDAFPVNRKDGMLSDYVV
ncbi:MAG TPA: VWA domain-containing protein [Bacilli bacterium]